MFILLKATLCYLATLVVYILALSFIASTEASPQVFVEKKLYAASTFLAPLIASAVFGFVMAKHKFTLKSATFLTAFSLLLNYGQQHVMHNGLYFGSMWDAPFLLFAASISFFFYWARNKLKK
jgi:hypothetical protein